ncbi:MAG: hypothetical protein ACI88H_004219, partial [Cocleimonas sp.]
QNILGMVRHAYIYLDSSFQSRHQDVTKSDRSYRCYSIKVLPQSVLEL